MKEGKRWSQVVCLVSLRENERRERGERERERERMNMNENKLIPG